MVDLTKNDIQHAAGADYRRALVHGPHHELLEGGGREKFMI